MHIESCSKKMETIKYCMKCGSAKDVKVKEITGLGLELCRSCRMSNDVDRFVNGWYMR